jgi:histidine triad (HIT) family protein
MLTELNPDGEPDCPFCQIIRGDSPARVVFSDDEVVAFFPTAPATLGHTLVVPRRHVPDIWSLRTNDAGPLWEATLDLARAIRSALHPDGLNVINSAGRAATQTVFHLHMHVVPRWEGDAIGDIWPPREPWNSQEADDLLDDLQRACSGLRRSSQ